jgi:hypothetical protein
MFSPVLAGRANNSLSFHSLRHSFNSSGAVGFIDWLGRVAGR